MRVLVTGANGRLGGALTRELPRHGYETVGLDLGALDVTDSQSVRAAFATVRPQIVIHCAALTAVDYCAEHPDEALAVNGFGTQTVALASQAHRAVLMYISTNEVFAGDTFAEYREHDAPGPRSPYGYSKWVGEQYVRGLLPAHYIVRTSWLFAHGGTNFIHTILDRGRRRQPLRVVVNEMGAPTYNDDLAEAICQLLNAGAYGTYHLVNEGYTSRFHFARFVLDRAGLGDVPLEPISAAQFQRASSPPEYAILKNVAAAHLGITLRPWRDAVTAFLKAEGLLAGDA